MDLPFQLCTRFRSSYVSSDLARAKSYQVVMWFCFFSFFFYFPALELVGPNYRSFVTVMTCTFYTCGIMMLAGVTYMIRDWVQLSYYTSMPFLVYFLYLFVMPESPRWLLMRGRLEEALTILKEMARVNEKQFPQAFKTKLERRILREKSKTKKKQVNVGVFDLCK